MELLFGILLIAIGAFMSSSFAVPFAKVKGWDWDNYWLIYSLFGYVVVPALACLIFAPEGFSILSQQPTSLLLTIFIYGIAYGFANLTFGLSLRYLGFSIGYALSLGLMMVLGTIIPPILDGRFALMGESGGGMLIAGIILGSLGVFFSGYAGYKKEQSETAATDSEFNLKKGLIFAITVGVTGSAQSFGIEQGINISKAMVEAGVDPLFQTLPLFFVLYSGSFLITLIWCAVKISQNCGWSKFCSGSTATVIKNTLYCALAGFLWFINYIFYGMGKSRMGELSFTAWGILMALTIVFATVWGIYRGEWKFANKRAKGWMYVAIIILIASSFVIGMSSM